DGWIRYFWYQSNEFVPETATGNLTPETLAWLEKNPEWDPRLRLARPEDRDRILAERAMRGALKYGGHVAGDGALPTAPDSYRRSGWSMMSFAEAHACDAAKGKAFDMALMGMSLEIMGLLGDELAASAPNQDDAAKGDTLDGVPEWFIGPMLAD